MLEVLRFWFTKDLKYAKGRPCKPYNSCLGEFFRCNWEAEDNAPVINHKSFGIAPASGSKGSAPGSSASSVKSARLAVPAGLGAGDSKAASTVQSPRRALIPPTLRSACRT